MAAPTSFIGDALSRVDGPLKVTGRARYAAEHFAPDLLYGWIVSSPIAKGRIVAVDDAACRAVAGVVEVLTHLNRPETAYRDANHADEIAPPGSPFRALHDEKVVFSGQPIALVVAGSLEAARAGAAAMRFEFERETAQTDLVAALPDRFEPKRKRDGFAMPEPRGDAEQALAAATYRVVGEYRLATEHHHPMEPHAATVIAEADGRFTVHDKTQGAHNVQAYLVAAFRLKKDQVRVLNPYVGGGFGSGLRPQYHVYLAMLAATKLGRSVRVTMTRQQMVTHVHRPEAIQSISLGCDGDGRLTAIVNDATTATSRFENYMEVVCNWGLMNYACPNASAEYTIAALDTCTPGDMRAPGAATGMTLFEIAIDELAVAAGVDPLEFRLRNYTDVDAMSGKPFTSKALREAYAQGAERFGWARRSAEPGSMREGRERIGWGLATGMWDAMFMKTAARARFGADGRLQIATGGADIGTGTYTILTQIASETLGLPVDRIDVLLGDSDLPASPVEGGSWLAASAGAAVKLACEALGKLLHEAARKAEGRPLGTASLEEVEFRDGAVALRGADGPQVSFEAALAASGKACLEAEETAKPGVLDLPSLLQKARNTHSAIFAEVRVDETLCVVRVTRIVIAVAAGRIINPKTARSQILGGVVMGLGMALHEESVLDHRLGRFMTRHLADYHVPSHADVENIEVIFVDEPDAEVTPLGVKGLGEIGIVGTAAAVVNAIHHATGVRCRSLPATIDKVMGRR